MSTIDMSLPQARKKSWPKQGILARIVKLQGQNHSFPSDFSYDVSMPIANNYHYYIKIRTLISNQRGTSFTVRKIRGQGPKTRGGRGPPGPPCCAPPAYITQSNLTKGTFPEIWRPWKQKRVYLWSIYCSCVT